MSGFKRPAVVVKSSPILYKLKTFPKENSSPCTFDLKYRCVFAVGTQDGAIIYDTQHLAPIVVVANLHYAPVTDLTW